MRKTWIVIAVVLLSVTPLAAQQKPVPKPAGQWAVAYRGETPRAVPGGTTYVLLPTSHAAQTAAPVAVLAVPVVAQPAAPPPAPACASGGCARRRTCDWKHLREWLCYRSLDGCSKKGSCGCNCSIPLYVYFLHECKEGRKFDLPPCARDKESPHFFRRMTDDARGMLRSCGTTASPCPCRTEPAVSYDAARQAAARAQ